MRPVSNAHIHTLWCDGENTAREMADAAAALEFSALGFSSHATARFETGCPGVADAGAYRSEINSLKESFAGKLAVFCGLEQDDYALAEQRENYDYIIHSTHYFPETGGRHDPVDRDPKTANEIYINRYSHDGIAMVEDYFRLLADGVRRYRPDIVGHYDLIVKFNSNNRMFDEDSKAYRQTALLYLDGIIDILNPYGGMVEINTGGMRYTSKRLPYSGAPFLLKRLLEKKARVIITGDSHSAKTLDYGYNETFLKLKAAGFSSMAVLTADGFVDINI